MGWPGDLVTGLGDTWLSPLPPVSAHQHEDPPKPRTWGSHRGPCRSVSPPPPPLSPGTTLCPLCPQVGTAVSPRVCPGYLRVGAVV